MCVLVASASRHSHMVFMTSPVCIMNVLATGAYDAKISAEALPAISGGHGGYIRITPCKWQLSIH